MRRNTLLFPQFHSTIKRRKSLNSTSWLERRDKDKYVELSKTENYRCRSAYKLLEINEKFKIIKPGLCAVDLGAAPGSWTQVLVRKTNADLKDVNKPQGLVVAVDKLPIYHMDNATILSKLDFTLPSSIEKLTQVLNGKKVNLVVSDMAPNATGIKELDQDGILSLALAALRFAVLSSSSQAACLIKIWDGGSRAILEKEMKRFYEQLHHVRPQATQTESSELFLLARGFKTLQGS